jgi:hypothetical protein
LHTWSQKLTAHPHGNLRHLSSEDVLIFRAR